MSERILPPRSHISLAAVLAAAAAAGAWVSTCGGHGGWGIALGLLAVFFGFIGFLSATSPRVSGGLISLLAILFGGAGALAGLLALLAWCCCDTRTRWRGWAGDFALGGPQSCRFPTPASLTALARIVP